MPMKLGELIVQEKLVTPEQLEEALVYQRQSGGRVGEILVKLGFATDEQIAEMVARKYDVPVIDLPSLPIDGSVLKLIPAETAQAYQLFPVSASGATLTVAMADPTNVFAIDDLRFMTGYNIEPVVAPGAAVMEAIEKHYESAHTRQVHDAIREAEDIDLEKLERSSDEAPVVKLCNLILTDALRRDSSEIHIEPFEHEVRVRFRIDGVLYTIMSIPLKFREAIANRFKIMSKLETSERRLPQDGVIRIRMRSNGKTREASYRISTLPTRHGESIVLRVTDTGGAGPRLR